MMTIAERPKCQIIIFFQIQTMAKAALEVLALLGNVSLVPLLLLNMRANCKK